MSDINGDAQQQRTQPAPRLPINQQLRAHFMPFGTTGQGARPSRALPAALLALTLLPLLLLTYARRENARAAAQFADVNISGSLRMRSIWLYGAGQPNAGVTPAARAAQRAQMGAILDALRARYPQGVQVTDAAWAHFSADAVRRGHVSWSEAIGMRNAADTLTRDIERQARTQARQASQMLLLGMVALALSGAGSFVLLRRLHKSEEMQRRLCSIIDTTPDMIGVADPQGHLIYLNHAFRRFLCLADDAPLPAMQVGDTHTPASREMLQTQSRPAALATGKWEGEAVLLHPTRGKVPMSQLLVAHRAPDGSLDSFFTMIRDITEHKAVEAALLEAEALFRSAVGAMQEGFLVQDCERKVLMANQWAETIMGMTRDDILGKVVMQPNWHAIREDGTPFAPEDFPSHCARRTGEAVIDVTMGLCRPEQPVQWLRVSAAPLFHAGETVSYAAVTTFSDISAQKADADALREAQERLMTVIGNAPLVLFSLDADGVFTTSEGKGLEILGLVPGQTVGQSVFDFLADNTLPAVQIRRALAGETVSYMSSLAGRMWDTQCRPLPGEGGGRRGVIGVSYDITGRHEAEEALRRGEERLRRLYEVTSDAALAFPQKLDRLLQMGCAEFGLETGLIAKLDEKVFEIVHSYHPGGPGMQGMTCDPHNTFCREALIHGEPLGIEHIGGSLWATHPAYHTWKPEAYLGTQVCVNGQSYGTLCFLSSTPRTTLFTTGDKDLLRLMAQWLGHEMQRRDAEQQMHDYNIVLEFQKQEMERANQELGQANAQLATLASTDGLTGLCNRRTLGERLNIEVVRARRYNGPLSLLLMDVDHFKQYNDSFGHPAGDHVLQTVGQILRDHARLTDLPARYGGEEFAVVLPETDAAGASVVAERIRRALERHVWPLRNVTISVGVATLAADTADSDALVTAADGALYRSKAAGRNRVTHASSPQEPARAPA